MEAAMAAGANEATVDDFTTILPHAVHYTSLVQKTRVISRPPHRFWVCGRKMFAIPDHVILDEAHNGFILFLGESKANGNPGDAEPQLIAEAIAAFQLNNTRLAELEQGPLDEDVMYGITMRGTIPVFYRIPVTSRLDNTVQTSQYPAEVTIVHVFHPVLPDEGGMLSQVNRGIILSCFAASRHLIHG